MAEIQSNIQVNIDTTEALANLKNLQRQLANFNASFAKSSTAAVRAQAEFSNNLVNSINATGKFAAGIQEIQSSTERFTQSLEKNKFSTREYFRYAAGSTKAFSKIFSSEFNTIQKVAEERVKDLQTQYIKMGRGANGALKAIAVRPLALDMEDLATKVAITSQKQQIFGQLLKQGSTNLLNFGKNTQWAGRQLMVGFTIPLTIFGSKAAQVFMDLEMQAIRFKRVYGEMFTTQGETTKALNEVRKLAQEFTKYGVAVADTMKMAADAAAQGKQGADLMAQVAEATRLAVLGQVEQQQALETTMSLQNAFGYSAEQLAGKINFLNAVENQTVVGIEDLTIAIPKAGPVVKQLGGDVEDLAFFLTAMKEGGINASEGANALKSGLASLINPTDKASGMLADLGINIKGIVEANKGDIKGTVIGFAQALDTLDPLNRARAIEQLFGKFQFARLSTLFQNVTRDGGQAARTLDLTGKSVEELAILSERELGAVENATGTKFKKAMEDLKVSIAPIGEQFLKAVTPIAEFFSKILNWFNGLSDGVKSGISKLVLIIGAVGPVVLMTFGLLANGLANIIKLFAAVRNGFLGLGKNSNQLAFQTKYMSSEQVEAATIAASLDQAHSKLIQTFTVEKNAVAQLAEVYRQAAMAAGRLQVANPGFFMPRAGSGRGSVPPQPPGMRLAKGIISVPGPKGAGDVVPAMLSPGESVIPAKQSEKYGPLIQGIIADNIPGFAVGKVGTEQSHFGRLKPENIVGTIVDPEMQQVMAAMGDFKVGVEVLGNGVDGLIEVVDFAEVNIKDLAKTLKENSVEIAYGSSRNPYEYGATGVRESKDRNRMYEAAGIAGAPLSYEELVKSGDIANKYAADKSRPEAKRKEAEKFYQESVDMQQQIASLSEDEKEKVKLDYSRQQHARAIAQKLTANGMQSQEATIKSQKMIADAEAQVAQLVAQRKTLAEKRAVLEKAHTATLFKLTPKLIGFDTTKERTLDNGGIFTRGQNAHAARDLAALNAGFGRVYGAGEQVPSEATNFGGSRIQQQRGARLRRKTSAFFRMGGVGGSLQDRSVIDPYMEARAKYFDKADPKINSLAAQSGAQIGKNLVQGTIQGANDEGQMASPSRRTYRQGQDLVRGMVNGITDESRRSSRQLRNTTIGANPLPMTRSGAAGGLQPAPKANLPQYTRDGIRIVPVGTTAPSVADDKDEQLRDAERQRRKTILARTNGVLFGLSSLSSVLGMMGNGIAQKAAPFLVGINLATMAMQMIQGPWSGLAVGVVALAGTMYYLDQKAKQQAEATSKLVDAQSATTEKMKEIGKITGKVGASELFARKRQTKVSDEYTTGYNRAGQQFGTSFLESDVGKNIFEGFKQSLSINGKVAVKQLGLQLASYVSDGLMDPDQARSIARAIGISMSDMTITSRINGQLRELIGPDGSNLLKDPLKVRINLITEQTSTVQDLQKQIDGITSSIDGFFNTSNKAFVDSIKTLWSELPEEKIATSAAAMGVQALETAQAQIDAQNNMYDKQIAVLQKQKEATKDKAKQVDLDIEINRLLSKRKEDEQTLRKQTKDILTAQINTLDAIKKMPGGGDASGAREAFFEGLKTQVRNKAKSQGQDAFAEVLLARTANLKSKRLEVIIDTVVGSGVLTSLNANAMLDIFAGQEDKLEKTFEVLLATQDPGKIGELFNILGSMSGKGAKKTALKIATQISAKGQEKNFDQRLKVLNNLQLMDGKEINMSAFLKVDGVEKLDQLAGLMAKVEEIPNPLDKTALLNLESNIGMPEMQAMAADWEFYASLPDELRKTAVQTFITISKTIGPKEIADYQKEMLGAAGKLSPSAADALAKRYDTAGEVANALNKAQYPEGGYKINKPKSTKTKDKKGDRDTTFDDINKKLKLFQQASVNALKGFKELKRVMDLPGKKGGAYMTFNGITNQLVATKKLSTDFIDMIEGLSPEELQKNFGKFGLEIEKGVVKFKDGIKAGAEQINKALASIAAGEIVANNAKEMQKLENRTAAVNKLRKEGIDYATAMAITESDSIALEIRNGRLKGEALDELVQSQQKRNDLEEYYNKVVLTKQQDAIVSQQTANEQMLEFLELQNAIAENQFIVQKTEIEIAAKRNGYTLELINYEEELVNKVYDKQIEALDEIIKRNEEINRLQEGRFSIAEALARGDMAAAARAIQSVRQQEIQAQLEAKRKGIEEARKKTLESITADGKTRKQIEEENAKNAAELAAINLDTVKKQIAYAQEFTKALGRTPEELKAYNDIAAKIQQIGGFKLDSQSLLSAIKDAVAGKPQALLSSVASVINERIKDLFGAKVAGVATNYDENGNPIPKPSEGGTNITPISLNTTATTDNTAALRALTEKITVGSISAKSQQEQGLGFGSGAVLDDWMFNRGLGFSFTPGSSSSKSSKKKTSKKKKSSGSSSGSSTKTPSTKNQPANPRQADGEIRSVITTPDGAWRELPVVPIKPVIPKQAIDALGNELKSSPTVSGSEIDITVRPNPQDVAATVARINHEEMLAREEKKRQEEARAAAQEQLRAAKQQEAAAARYSDTVNRQSPMQLEMAAAFNQTIARLERTVLVAGRSLEITNNLDERGAALADVLDNPKAPAQAVAALANENNGYLGAIARAQQESSAQLAQENAVRKSTAALSAEDAKAEAEAKRQAELKAAADAEANRLKALRIAGLALGNEENLGARGEVYNSQQAAVTKAKQDAASAKSQKALDNENMLYGLGIQLGQIASTAKIVKEAAINKSTKALESQDTRGVKIAAATAAQVVANAQGPIVQKVSNILDRTDGRDFTDYNAKISVGNTLKTAQQTATTRATEQFLRSRGMNMGGIVTKYFASGGYGKGTDIIPAMLTPGEFVVRKAAVDSLGVDTMQSINRGELPVGNSVYNYSLSVNVSNSNANPNDIARVVINQIKQIDSQRIRSNR